MGHAIGTFFKALWVMIMLSFWLSYLGFAQEQLGPDGFPTDWKKEDYSFSILEPAAGLAVSSSAPKSKITPLTLSIEQMPTTGGQALSGTVALPPALPNLMQIISSTNTVGQVFQPLNQAFPQGSSGQSVAADLGIVVTEQPVANGQSSLASLAAYGPLSSGVNVAEGVWLGQSLQTQTQRLKTATAKPLKSPALKEAWRRLLLASAAAPVATPKTTPPHWLATRAETLESLGMYEAAWSLWREAEPQLRQPTTPPELVRGWAQASLLAGQTNTACPLVREQAAAGMVSDFWPSAAAVCAAAELADTGNPAALGLAIQLMPTRVIQEDPALLTALTAIRDNTQPKFAGTTAAWPVGALVGATLASAPTLLTADTLPLLPDTALRRLRESPRLTPPIRQQAALSLAGQTAWADDAKGWLPYITSPTLPAKPQASWPDAALLSWAQASLADGGALSSSTQPLLRQGYSEQAAALVVPAALRLGQPDVASSWWPLWQGAENLNATQLRERLQARMALNLARKAPVQDLLAPWQAARSPSAEGNRRVLAVLEGVGTPVPAAVWEAVNADAPQQADTLNMAWQRLLDDAAAKLDTPAVLSMVSEALRGQNAASASPAVVQASLQALQQVGLPDIAQRLAAEALTLTPTAAATRVLQMEAEPDTKPAPRTTPTVPQPTAPKIQKPKAPLLPKPKV